MMNPYGDSQTFILVSVFTYPEHPEYTEWKILLLKET